MSDKTQPSRADAVRRRRAREDARKMERAAREATRPMPPVTSRARQDVVKSKRRPTRGGSARQRFQIALLPVAPDAQMRGISIPRPQLGWRLLSFVLVAVLVTTLYFAFNHPKWRVIEAQLTGNQILTPADVNASLEVAGKPIFLLIPSDLEARLRRDYPELVSVKVTVTLPNLVSVQIAERQPLIRWEQGTGYTWISEDGVAIRPRGEMLGLIPVVALSAPPLDGIVSPDSLTPPPFISTELVQALKGLVGHLPPGTPILYDSTFGFGWSDPRGWRVYFGTSASDVELKMRVYGSMVGSLTQRGIRPALINVTYPTAPYYRMSE